MSVPYLPPDTERHLAEWGWGLRVQKPPSWDKAAVWAQVVVEAVSFLPRGKVQRRGQGPRQGGLILTATGRVGQPGSFQVLPRGPAWLWAGSSGEAQEPRRHRGRLGDMGSSALGSGAPGAQSRPSSERHLRAWSLCASGRIWFRIPPSRLDVASVARMRGFTTVGGSWRITPPTAPVSPFCSWPREATSQMV